MLSRARKAVIILGLFLLASSILGIRPSFAQGTDELRELIAEAYMAVADAEDKGGNVSMLVEELNKALGLIEQGKKRDAETILRDILASAPEVGHRGLEMARAQKIKTGFLFGLLFVAFLMVWRYGPRVFWSLWLRSKQDWRVGAK